MEEAARASSPSVPEPLEPSVVVITEIAAVASPPAPSTPDLERIAPSKDGVTSKRDLAKKNKKLNVTFEVPKENTIKHKLTSATKTLVKPNNTAKGDQLASTPKHNHGANHEQMGSFYTEEGLRASARKYTPSQSKKLDQSEPKKLF